MLSNAKMLYDEPSPIDDSRYTMSDNNWKNRLEALGGRFSGNTFLGLDADHAEESAERSGFMTVLSHETITSVSGPDAVRFLQGQVTCDVNQLAPEHSSLGACCTPKGRMIANFRVLNHDSRLLLTMPASDSNRQHDALKTHLSKYIVFYKAEIGDASDEWLRIGIFGDTCEKTLSKHFSLPEPNHGECGDGYCLLQLPGIKPRYELWLQPDAVDTWWPRLTGLFQVQPTSAWQHEDIRNGIAWVIPETREAYIPQHFNWQILEGVSFKKGCYTGQEIVARMQYLGKLKSRLYRLTGTLEELPAPGTKILTSSGKSAGEIVSAISPVNTELLAVLRSDAISDTLTTELSANAPFSVEPLPYNVDA
ncbi:folate-binding protein YgfZ [Kistimonas scapharcae]|uniref:Folate-binding protein YgfZ n=1 Tax=Kistimonas scapharcae TaxID=1036133 RepID=A0ABP8UWS2_9GAMM